MKALTTLVLMAFITMSSMAQQKMIKGNISDESGMPLPGVNILIKGTTTGTQSDFDGNYEILTNVGDVLSFTYVGLKTVEETVGTSNVINVTMQGDSALLEEVVVMGYASRREKKSLGFAVRHTSKSKSKGVSRVLSGRASGLETSNNEDISGQLTAGEINDLKNWEDWMKSLKHRDFRDLQQKWSFYLKNRINVKVHDVNNNPLSNISVNFYSTNNENLFTTKTDALGEATIFVEKTVFENENHFLIQLISGENIVGKKITKTHKNIDFVLEESLQNNDADIMFTIDATGSMGDEMNYLKAELENIFDRLDESIKSKRLGLTFYRDHGDSFVVKEFDFTSDISKMKKVLNQHHADGGGDYEEAVEEALKASLNKSWNFEAKSKLLFLLLDAPPHYTRENVEIIQTQIKKAQEYGIKIIPIVASDANKNVEFLMRFFSVSTNGTYVFITDDSGIGNDHIEPTNSKYEVEKLNDLIVRLINKYCGVQTI